MELLKAEMTEYRALQQFFKWLAAEDEWPDPMAGLQPPRVTGTTSATPGWTAAAPRET